MSVTKHPCFIHAITHARLLPRHVNQIIMYVEAIEAEAAALLDEAEAFFQAQGTFAPELSKADLEPDRPEKQSDAPSSHLAALSQSQTTYSPPQVGNRIGLDGLKNQSNPSSLTAKPSGVEA